MINVKLVLFGHCARLINPLTKEVVKSFPVIISGALPFRERITDYLKQKKLYVVNAHSLTWNPND